MYCCGYDETLLQVVVCTSGLEPQLLVVANPNLAFFHLVLRPAPNCLPSILALGPLSGAIYLPASPCPQTYFERPRRGCLTEKPAFAHRHTAVEADPAPFYTRFLGCFFVLGICDNDGFTGLSTPRPAGL